MKKYIICAIIAMSYGMISYGQVTITSQYKPLTYEDYARPLREATEAFNALSDKIIDLAEYMVEISSKQIDDELRDEINAEYKSLTKVNDQLFETGNLRAAEAGYNAVRNNVRQSVMKYNGRVAQANGSSSGGYSNRGNSSSSAFAPQSQDYAYYTYAGFAISRNYYLEENTYYKNAYKQVPQDTFKLVAAYTCAQNAEKNDPQIFNLININVLDFKGSSPSQDLYEYRQALTANGITNMSKTWNGLTGVEYSFEQDMGGVMFPTKAFYGYKGNRFYLIQLGSLTNCSVKFNTLLNSIRIL